MIDLVVEAEGAVSIPTKHQPVIVDGAVVAGDMAIEAVTTATIPTATGETTIQLTTPGVEYTIIDPDNPVVMSTIVMPGGDWVETRHNTTTGSTMRILVTPEGVWAG